MRLILAAIAAVLLLAGCSKSPEGSGSQASESVAKQEAAPPAGSAGAGQAIKVSLPQIAYTYRYGYSLPASAITAAQERHIALCDQLGIMRCRVLDMQRAVGDGDNASGSLKLMVRADLARPFGRALAAAVSQSGGSQADSSIAAEDLSKQIVDTDARLRAKQALAARLMELLRTRSGPVSDLVAAERSVADVQEEIDAAQSWLAEARGRVAMSTFELSYNSNGWGGGFLAPLRSSTHTMTTALGYSLATLIQLIALLLPWVFLGALVVAGWRAFRRWRSRGDVQ